ncbi:hypothetical protein ID866_9766 [Astraeus odoratus]|nr:hypothetical protein ID866_9766 [Astraeus odoratus]
MVGGPRAPGDDTPRAVNKHFFEKVCPNPTVIRVSDVNTDDMRFSDSVPATYVFDKWVETINAVDDPCLMLDPNGNQIFEIWIFGNNNRMLTLWPFISNSLILIGWDWSPLIHAAYRRNRHFFEQSGFSSTWNSSVLEDLQPMIEGLLAIHVRRGDFEEHCRNLASWEAEWNAWNSFPELIDKFEKPKDLSSEDVLDVYLQRCYPSIQQIVDKVRRVRQESLPTHDLRYLYIMTNGPSAWVEELKASLERDSRENLGLRWESVKSSRDLELTWEEKFVAQAVDMFAAQKAEVIIGNGVSSYSGNYLIS